MSAYRSKGSNPLFADGAGRQHSAVTDEQQISAGGRSRIGLDWWATIVAGVVVALAVAGWLPRIPW